MTRQGLPDDVQRFLREHIRSVGELEVLLLLHRHHDRWWSPQEVNEELRTSLQSARDCLGHLHDSKLIERRDAGDQRGYRLHPSHAGEQTLVGQLADLFKLRVSSVIDAIYAPKGDTLREFADAFRLIPKKDKDGDDG